MSPIERSVLPPILRALGDRVGHREDLVALIVKQQVVVAEVGTAHMPVEILRLQIEGEHIGQHRVQRGSNIADGIFAESRRGTQVFALVGDVRGQGCVHDGSPRFVFDAAHSGGSTKGDLLHWPDVLPDRTTLRSHGLEIAPRCDRA